MEWIKVVSDKRMKKYYYPEVEKENLIKDGYIAERSGHSKGNTIDLGLVSLGSDMGKIKNLKTTDCRLPLNDQEKKAGMIDMGSKYDCFDAKSHTKYKFISKMAKKNREMLLNVMEEHGFKNYKKEWWHYSFKPNKYPNTFFDFPIE